MLRLPAVIAAAGLSALVGLVPSRAAAEATLLVESDTGKVLHAENATYPWYPASVTKLMTAYLTLQAIRNRKLTLDSTLTMSARAAAQAPSKMGFKPGTVVTVDNALKMLMVKSANDIAYLLAEGIGGSVEKFADEMNASSRRLGMTQSHWVNPNGLPAENQISSARDLAILARALLREFPEYDAYWHIPAIKFGKKVMRNTNSLIGRYEGADGMKTGFICASGFNVVASASRNGKRLIVVVLGAPSSPVRAVKAANLLERGFHGSALGWLTPSLGNVESLPAMASAPPDLRDDMCGKHRKRPAAEEAEEEPDAFTLANLLPGGNKPTAVLADRGPVNPVVVYAGPAKKSGQTLLAAAGGQPVSLDGRKGGKKGKNAKSNQVASADGAVVPESTPAPAAAQSGGFVPASLQVAPPPGRFTPTSLLPSIVSDPHTAPLVSFAPTAHAADAPPPLTSMPAAAAPTAVPMPRPRPKIADRKR